MADAFTSRSKLTDQLNRARGEAAFLLFQEIIETAKSKESCEEVPAITFSRLLLPLLALAWRWSC